MKSTVGCWSVGTSVLADSRKEGAGRRRSENLYCVSMLTRRPWDFQHARDSIFCSG